MAHTIYKDKNSKRVPSVTTILSVISKPALYRWHNIMGLQGIDTNKFVNETAIIGSTAHKIIECHLKNEPENFEDIECKEEHIEQARVSVSKYLEWESYQDEFEVIASELKLVSEKYSYGGTIDCIAKLNGVITLIDFKTCNSIWNEAKYQVSAYKKLAEENGYKIEQCVILRVGRDAEENYFEYVPLTKKQTEQGFKIFKSALQLYSGIKDFEKIKE